jgi:hypothetical protein
MRRTIKLLNQIVVLQFTFPLLARLAWLVVPSRRKRNLHVKKEVTRLKKALSAGNLVKAVLVYDNSISPPSYGDFINVLMIGRVLAAHEVAVELILANSVLAKNYLNLLSQDQLDEFIEEEKKMAAALVAGIKINVCSSRELIEVLDQREKDGVFIIFHDYVKSNQAFYYLSFDFTKQILSISRSDINNLTLFSKNSTLVDSLELPKAKYVSFACRWNLTWGQYRNMSADLFIKLVKLLKTEFPNHDLLVVSDQKGCDHFRKIANENQLICLFSKDYSDSFLGDATLVLNSEAWVQFRGGGIGSIPIWSDLPFLFFGRISSERSLLKKSTSQLRNDNQRFIVDYGLPSDRRIRKFLSQLSLNLNS